MTDRVHVAKVVCYIVHDGRILVFRHVHYSYEEVGVQVPVGTVRDGETPESAALREAQEETGLATLRLVSKLGEADYEITPYRFEVQRRHFFHLAMDSPTPERWASQERHDEKEVSTALECVWIPLQAGHILQSGQGALLGRLFA